MNNWNKTILLLIINSLLLVIIQPAYATLGVWSSRMSWINFSGSSDAISAKMVRKLINVPAKWAADIASYTDNPPITITLGWTYFSATEKCGSVVKQNIQGGARSVQKKETAKSIIVSTMSCSSTRYGKSSGRHEYKYGGNTVRDDWYQQDVIP